MTKIEDFLKKSPLYPALALEKYFSASRRRIVIQIAKYLLFSIPILIILSVIFDSYGVAKPGQTANVLIDKLFGLTLITLAIYILMHAFEAYFASTYYFEHISKNRYQNKELYTFSVGRVLRKVTNDNLLTGFLRSQSVGRKILKRLGITEDEINILLMKQAEIRNCPLFDLSGASLIRTSTLASFIYNNFPDFAKVLTDHGINEVDYMSTVDWVVNQIETAEYNRQWWKPEKLAQITGVAADWSFGRTYLLNKYSRNILDDVEVNSDLVTFSPRTREVEQVETILTKEREANIVLVGSPGQEKIEVLWNLGRKIRNRTTNSKLLNKKLLLFLTSAFTGVVTNNDFEEKLIAIFDEAFRAGNVILVIDNLPKLITQAKQFNLNLYELIEPYLSGIGGQIVAMADTDYFHTLIENDKALMTKFEVVNTKTLLVDDIIKIIASEALVAEKTYGVTFTYQSIAEIAKSADYYFPDGISSDKAEDLLKEISPWAVENEIDVINKEDVLRYVGGKINIPLAQISLEEKDKLLNLEAQLMKRVVAQKEAIFAVASAIRRNRSGVRNENRPIGSFLFLGPTGVGKTETAKALAEVFFGDEKLLLRLDMSEYQNDESLARLIGSMAENKPGILANLLREHPYGVLLLDEFEKTNKEVLNLFLQIIDEGFFQDVTGKKVLARNIIFVATSNAGAEKIFNMVAGGKDLKLAETEIISSIIKSGVLKPELINRFDNAIIFHPLSKENLLEIARLMLQKVAGRLTVKGITFSLNQDLISFIANGGHNPTFGARPMNRLIQDTIEDHLADLIIRGQLEAGKTVTFKVLSNTPEKNSLKPLIS